MKLLMILHFHLMLIPALHKKKKKKGHNKQIHIAYDYEFICISNS